MPRSLTFGLGAGAALGASALLLLTDRRERRIAERLAAASLETLLKAIDANDAMTGAHVRRVAAYALILARAAGLDEKSRRSVERIALFHDIGKIHEALFDIIHEEGGITSAERELIATHPERGAEVLAPVSEFYPDLCRGVLSHHERWDGSGYPRGLRGSDIPLQARIVAIADTFDAIHHRRRYAPGRSMHDALRAIREGRGSQFEPRLVDLFLRHDVVGRVKEAARQMRQYRTAPPVADRRAGKPERPAPDITFRWRTAPDELPERDREPRTPHGSSPHRSPPPP